MISRHRQNLWRGLAFVDTPFIIMQLLITQQTYDD